MKLRPYQELAIAQLYEWFANNSTGDPCIVMPTGSGKSLLLAAIIKDAVTRWPQTRILVLTHSRELIAQDTDAIRALWPNAPAGVYSAGLRRREVDRITVAGIQSVRTKAALIGHIDLCIVDEAHSIHHKDEGGYRSLINDLRGINPRMRVIGLTATPWRLGHGRIDDGDALFSALLEPVSIRELIYNGYLAPLRSRATHARYDVSGVHKRGGEYIERELQHAVDTDPQNVAVAREIVELAGDRKAWLIFCTGVDHAYHMRDALRSLDITTETVTGKTPRAERDDILGRYKTGEITALTNAEVLTTGFNYPGIDLIALLRPTMSPGLYMQMVGRGFRIKPHTDHCLVLDFAGVIAMHGPVTDVDPPTAAGDGEGAPPSKECPDCMYIIAAGYTKCPNCGYEFPGVTHEWSLRDDDIMGDEGLAIDVDYWTWEEKTSKAGNPMLVVSYYSTDMGAPVIREYLLIWSDGFAGTKGRKAFEEIRAGCAADLSRVNNATETVDTMQRSVPPSQVRYEKNGKYYNVIARSWA